MKTAINLFKNVDRATYRCRIASSHNGRVWIYPEWQLNEEGDSFIGLPQDKRRKVVIQGYDYCELPYHTLFVDVEVSGSCETVLHRDLVNYQVEEEVVYSTDKLHITPVSCDWILMDEQELASTLSDSVPRCGNDGKPLPIRLICLKRKEENVEQFYAPFYRSGSGLTISFPLSVCCQPYFIKANSDELCKKGVFADLDDHSLSLYGIIRLWPMVEHAPKKMVQEHKEVAPKMQETISSDGGEDEECDEIDETEEILSIDANRPRQRTRNDKGEEVARGIPKSREPKPYPNRQRQHKQWNVDAGGDPIKECARALIELPHGETIDILPYYRRYAATHLPQVAHNAFAHEQQWEELAHKYKKTYGRNPFIFEKKEGDLQHQFGRFKEMIERDLYETRMITPFKEYNDAMGNGIPRQVLGRQNYLPFLDSIKVLTEPGMLRK